MWYIVALIVGFMCGFFVVALVARKAMRDKLRALGIEPIAPETRVCEIAYEEAQKAMDTHHDIFTHQKRTYTTEVSKMAERVFKAVCPKCRYRDRYNHFDCVLHKLPGSPRFATCPLDDIKKIREELENV